MSDGTKKYLICLTYDRRFNTVWQIIYRESGKVVEGHDRIGSRSLAKLSLSILEAKDRQEGVASEGGKP